MVHWLDATASTKQKPDSALKRRLRELIKKPSRKRIRVNLYKIDKYSKDGDNVVVPGKVLSTGKISHKLKLSAVEYSAEALKALKEAQCTVVDIAEMVKEKRIIIIV